ncbi:hypothetical protein NEUTE1DRAFT_60437 [Neurospora tetrasperma FGSC 2508]|uniref:Uncharacterized protein n=1 Tax=Neurospora tetrasperma (strain FGSC 2508 / ATCC MYA-4615 / P0657) TaxID=510951 RepID=F8MFJ5_NEUT8|nr:uncharacterized protein NEUTE1DRAFT_60437 [Neurospora tetrasperma FGSC 2508]EGO59221.1 hypothetical protein NEUTE1DRAFT_60437 [Neurospora tetrasperma FGSC 2508]EGZ73335.1 hypothetical protein NEUTE2DRAFT_107798 [Neurospora tetrasperma FGSC 2509]
MASQRKDRPQRNRKPPKIYGFHVSGQEEDTFTDFEPPSPPHRPIDTRLPFDPQLVEECAFPSLDPVTHVGLGPSEVYKVYRQARREQEVKRMVEYEPLYHERLAQLKQRKQVVGRRDIGEFPGGVVDNRSRGRSRGVSVQYANTPEERVRWERGREQEFVWAVGESSSEEEDEEKEEEEEEDEDEDDHVQQRDTLMRTSRLLLSVRNANHTKQKEAVAAVERARSHAQSLASSQGQKSPGPLLPLAPASASAEGKNQKDADGDTVMGGGTIHEPPYSFAQLSTLLSLSTDEIISLLYLINHETRKMIVLDSLSNQLAAIEDIDAVRGALDRLKPQGLVTDSVSSEDIRQGQAFLRFMGLHKVAEWLAEYVGVSNSRDSNEGRHVIKINGRLLDGDIPAEVAGNVLRRIWKEEQERATRIENARRAEAAKASMQPPPLGLVNRSVLELTDRSVQNGKVLTIQEAEQAARRLADFGLLVPQSDHYTVSLNGESVHLKQDLQARRLWNHELEAMRKAQRQNEAVPPARPTLESNEERQPSRPTLDQVAGSSVGNREEHRQGVRETSRGQATLVQQPPPSTGAISSAPVPMDIDSSMNRATRHDKEQQQKGQPSSSANEVDQEASIADESQSRNSPTNDYLLSIGIDLSFHKPPPLDTSSGSPTLEERTAAFLAANKATLDAIDKEDEMEARLRRRQPAQGQAHDEEPAISAYGLRYVSEARTLRSNSIYSSRLPSEAPSVVPAANTTPTTARGNRQATPVVANPSGSGHEMSAEIQRQVQVVTEAGASSVAPHNALAGNGNSNQVPTAVTIQREEARPVAVVTPPAPETPASQRKTRIILKVRGRRVTSQSSITFTDTPRSEPPVHTSPHTLGRNFSEPTRRHRELSQEISFGDNATDHTSSRSSFKQSLPTRRNLFGTTRQQQHASFSTSGTLTASNHIQSQIPMPSLVIGGHPTNASSHPSHLQRPSMAGFRDLASTEPGSHRQNELGLAAPMPPVIPVTISSTQANPSQVIRAVADRESQQTMRGGAAEEDGKRYATRSQVHSEEQGESGP